MKTRWNITKPHRIPSSENSGLFVAHTEAGRYILTYSSSPESAHNNFYNSIGYSDRIISISREHF